MRDVFFVLIGIILCLVPLGARAQAVVSEVLWMGDDLSTSNEWLEIAAVPCGAAACPSVDLSGWSITYMNSSGVETNMVTLPAGTTVADGSPIVVARHDASSSRLAAEPTVVAATVSLPNTKLLLHLFDASGALVDTVDDGVGAPFAGANPSGGAKASMERIDLTARGDDKDNWRTSTASAGFDEGAAVFGTPGSVDAPADTPEDPPIPPPAGGSGSDIASAGSGAGLVPPVAAEPPRVIIGGVLPNPAGSDAAGEWIELKNLSPVAARLDGWTLVGKGATSAKTVALDGIFVDASSSMRLFFSQTQLSLTNTKFTLELDDAYGLEASEVSWESAGEDRVYRPNLYTDLVVHATASRVIDGDTLDVVFDQEQTPDLRQTATVRLIGVDAPESVHPTIKPQPYGKEASEFLRGLLEGKKVELQFDTNNWDTYDRLLAYVTVDEQVLAQERLLSTGLAKVYPDYPFARRGLFDQYEAQAKAQHAGMWAVPSATAEYKVAVPALAVQSDAVSAFGAQAPDQPVRDTPPIVSDAAWPLLRLSEIYAHPPSSFAHSATGSQATLMASEWIEVRNTGSSPMTMSGWSIRIGEGSKAKAYLVHPAVTVPAQGYAVLTGEMSTFKLRDGGNTVSLLAPDAVVTSAAVYPAVKSGWSWVVDGTDGCLSQRPEPGVGNGCSVSVGDADNAETPAATTKSRTKPKKTSGKKSPTPQFVLAQETLGKLYARADGETTDLSGTSGDGFWQAVTFLIAAVSLCQGGLICLMAWKTGVVGRRTKQA